MFGYEIAAFLSKYKSIYSKLDGICSINNLPRRLKKHSFLIVNQNKSHWILLYRARSRVYELFDPLGEITGAYIKRNIPYTGFWTFNTSPVQSLDSTTCGFFNIYLICHRLFNLDLSYYEILNTFFSSNVKKNERRVRKFVNKAKPEQLN